MMRLLIPAALAGGFALSGAANAQSQGNGPPPEVCDIKDPLPNIIVFLVDDLGYNQVGYHAEQVGNDEVETPKIDAAAKSGIIMNRGYMTPWCAPSRAAFQSGRTNAFNQNVSNNVWSFDDSLGEGFVGGMPPGTVTLASALKDYSSDLKTKGVYKTSYAGKWGIGGTAWANTPMGMGYDEFLGFWGDSIETCDGWQALLAVPPPTARDASIISTAVPGYWQQSNTSSENVMCPFLQDQTDLLTPKEINIACKSTPRTPPKIMDLDLMENTVDKIRNHDYGSGPLYHMHAPQLMHLPIQYPKAYDEGDYEPGAEKKEPGNTDIRITTRNAMKFVDDIFGNITQAIVDAGQWHNTIVLFSSDNGGAIYTNTVNNNYPLRGSKFNAFEGGLRVPQFLSGGWIDKNVPSSRSFNSSTYAFVNDWGPTLLEMVGGAGSKEYLLGDLTGPQYGNELWEYIKNSILPPNNNKNKPSQMNRTVSYSSDLYFNVTEETTYKLIYTGNSSVYTPRHWNATWPLEGELIPDLGYTSVKPCRKDRDTPYDCCLFDLEHDPREFHPKPTDCDEQLGIANSLYNNTEICETFPSICYNSTIPEEDIPVDSYTLWSHYGASGPFTNSHGEPVGTDLNMKCICDGFHKDAPIKQTEVESFKPGIFSPALCRNKSIVIPELSPIEGINCEGGFARIPNGGILEAYVAQGVPKDEMKKILDLPPALIVPDIGKAMSEYVNRSGFVEWASYAKFPQVITNLNSCPRKQATIVPITVETLTPWLGQSPAGDPTNPRDKDNLCITWNPKFSWCPSITNAEQKYVVGWDYNKDSPKGFFADGEHFPPVLTAGCVLDNVGVEKVCVAAPEGTAYIVPVDEKNIWGITAGQSSCNAPNEKKCKKLPACKWEPPEDPNGECVPTDVDTSSLTSNVNYIEDAVTQEEPNAGCTSAKVSAFAFVAAMTLWLHFL